MKPTEILTDTHHPKPSLSSGKLRPKLENRILARLKIEKAATGPEATVHVEHSAHYNVTK
jgi:hypothetical protein